MLKFAIGTALALIASCAWLYSAWAHGHRTRDWVPVIPRGSEAESDAGARRQASGWLTSVQYVYDGKHYEVPINDFVAGEVVLYVNPENPGEAVVQRGPTVPDTIRPLIATIFFGLFALVLVLIHLSPKET